jgi:fatty acid desaturase
MEDYMHTTLEKLEDIQRSAIVNSAGVTFSEFRKQLKPKYFTVWRDITLGYVVLLFTGFVAVAAQEQTIALQIAAGAVCAGLFGYFLAYLQLFFHEAAHYNIAKDRKKNDTLANIFIGALVGQEISVYRPIHLMHHRYLGTVEDTEHSYFDGLTFKYILESMTGIRVLKVLSSREKVMKSKEQTQQRKLSNVNSQLLIGAALNGAIVILAIMMSWYILAASWTIGILVVFPFFGAVRQLLEHRGEYAHKSQDYTLIPHGEVNRMFGDGPLASTLGAAGFNRHLLHHWEPAISYTCFRELEMYLMDTQVADFVQSRQTSYMSTFLSLFGK